MQSQTKKIEIKSKTKEEAIQTALLKLGVEEKDIEVNVIQNPSKGFLGLIGAKDGIYEMNLYWNTETLKWSFEVVKKNEFVNMIIESKQYYEIDKQAEDYIAKTFKKYYSILMNNNNRN